jgi:hypothetical protein
LTYLARPDVVGEIPSERAREHRHCSCMDTLEVVY